MRIESKLCHISDNKAVVQVNGWLNDKNLGSALAEAPTVEDAEDKAISRLQKRINGVENDDENRNSINEEKTKPQLNIELPKTENIDKIKINQEPCDWSNELTEIDLEIKRLKWTRDDEIDFLVEKLGYNNRNKITEYSEILNYLNLLKTTENPDKSKEAKLNVSSLLEQSDTLLRDLSWDHIKGREYLKKEFNVSTRKELNENQLILFVEQLKLIRNQYQAN